MNFSSTQQIQIECILTRWSTGKLEARFTRLDGFFLCLASIDIDCTASFEPRNYSIDSIEVAGQVQIGLQMAIEWVAGELIERQAICDGYLEETTRRQYETSGKHGAGGGI